MWMAERRRPALKLPALTVVLTGLPLLYYAVLGHTDSSWKLARDASKHGFSLGTILLAVSPLLLAALFAWRPRQVTFFALLTRLWPVAAVIVWVVSASSLAATPAARLRGDHPAAVVLAVEGVGRLRLAAPSAVPALPPSCSPRRSPFRPPHGS